MINIQTTSTTSWLPQVNTQLKQTPKAQQTTDVKFNDAGMLKPVNAGEYFSDDEKSFMETLQKKYGLTDSDMNAFNEIGLMRATDLRTDNPSYFSPAWLEQRIHTKTGQDWSNKAYEAAIDFLQANPTFKLNAPTFNKPRVDVFV